MGGRGRGGGGGYVGRDKVRFRRGNGSTETPWLTQRRRLATLSSFVSRTADDADRYFRVGFVPARALTARHPTVKTPQTKGRTMATANKLSVPKPVNLPSMKKVRGVPETRTANRMCPSRCRKKRSSVRSSRQAACRESETRVFPAAVQRASAASQNARRGRRDRAFVTTHMGDGCAFASLNRADDANAHSTIEPTTVVSVCAKLTTSSFTFAKKKRAGTRGRRAGEPAGEPFGNAGWLERQRRDFETKGGGLAARGGRAVGERRSHERRFSRRKRKSRRGVGAEPARVSVAGRGCPRGGRRGGRRPVRAPARPLR